MACSPVRPRWPGLWPASVELCAPVPGLELVAPCAWGHVRLHIRHKPTPTGPWWRQALQPSYVRPQQLLLHAVRTHRARGHSHKQRSERLSSSRCPRRTVTGSAQCEMSKQAQSIGMHLVMVFRGIWVSAGPSAQEPHPVFGSGCWIYAHRDLPQRSSELALYS